MEKDKSRDDKPHISPSQIDTYLNCGEAYRRRYVEGERLPPSAAMLRGSGVHLGAEYYFMRKLEMNVDSPIDEVVERAVGAFDTKLRADGLLLNPDEEERGKSIVVDEARDSVARLTELFMRGVAPGIKPRLIEHRVRIRLPKAPRDLLTIMDLVDEDEYIHDYKTTTKKKTQNDVDRDFQFGFMPLCFKAKFGRAPKGLKVQVLIDKKQPEVQVLETQRSTRDFEAILNRVNIVVNGIEKGHFMPAPANSWKCSPNFCGYFKTCKYVNGSYRAKSRGTKLDKVSDTWTQTESLGYKKKEAAPTTK